MSTPRAYRVGLIAPSSNVTMETEIPALLRAYEAAGGPSFTFHGARMRMKKVTAEALLAMDKEGATCAAYLADAQVGLPMLSAAGCTTRQILRSLNLDPGIPGFGSFLSQPQEVVQ